MAFPAAEAVAAIKNLWFAGCFDAGYWMLDAAGYWILDAAGYWMLLDAGC